jgi:hypothetical protein
MRSSNSNHEEYIDAYDAARHQPGRNRCHLMMSIDVERVASSFRIPGSP